MASLSRNWKQKLMIGLLGFTMTFSFGAAVHADEVQEDKTKQEEAVVKLTDIENHWAKDAIEKMAELGIINGYQDSTYRPNNPVTQLQAVTIVTNVLKHHAEDLQAEGNDYIGEVPDYAKEIVELAIYNDIIDWEELQPFGQKATRMFVANLLGNVLSSEADSIDESVLTFKDINLLSDDEKSNLALAVKNEIVSGHEDNTFRPNNSVTRGQMATFANRLNDKLAADKENIEDDFEHYEVFAGKITNINAQFGEITIGSNIFKVSETAIVKINDQQAKFSDLETQMEIRAIVKDATIVEIIGTKPIKEEKPGEDRVVTGKITDVSTIAKTLKVDSKTFNVSTNVYIEVNGELADFKYLDKEMEVVLIVVKDQIQSIYAFKIEDQTPLDFKIENSDGKDQFKEAKLTGDRVSDATPDIEDGKLSIRLNGGSKKDINLKEIDGKQANGNEVANELEEAIEDALNSKRVQVSFDSSRNRFIFETDNSSKTLVPSIQFSGDKDVLDALGIDTDLVKGSSVEASMKITVKSDATRSESYEVRFNVVKESIDVKVQFTVKKGDTATDIADELADALENNSYIRSVFDIEVDDEEVTLTPDDEDLVVEIEIEQIR